jgi:Flp pilus assembly protein TadB
MRKDQIPVGTRNDPLAGLDVSLLNFLRWLGILGTLIFGVVTIWFFITAHRGLSVGFLFATILFGVVWRVMAQRFKRSN